MFLILIATLLIALYAYYKISIRVLEKFANNIPGDNGLPILGNVGEFIKAKTLSGIFYKLHELTDKHSEEGIMKFWLGTKLMILVWSPEYLEIIGNSPQTANKGKIYSYFLGKISTGVVIVDGGPVWKELRKPLTKSLTKKLVEKDYLPVFVRRSNDFTDFIKQNREGKNVDIEHDIGALAFEMVFDTLIGINTNEVLERKWNFTQLIYNFGMVVATLLKYQYHIYKFTSSENLLDKTFAHLNKLQQWVLDERRKCINDRKEVGEAREYYPDFLLRRGQEKNIPDVELRKELTDVIVAGVDTAGVTVSSAIVFLAMFPEVQEMVHRELADIFQDSDRDMTHDDLPKMSYLEMVIKETLRYVVAPGFLRNCEQHLKLGKYTIPEGCHVYIFTNRVHHDPKYWERPHSFYPEHFLPESEAERPSFAYIPFGIGPRACPGPIYAMCQTKVMISTILRSFRVTTHKKFDDIVYDYSLMLNLDSYEVKFERK